MGQDKKDISFEINLLPVISLLAVCISFLLLTAVWVHIGTMDVSQAIGDSTESNKPNPPAISAQFTSKGDLVLTLSDVEEAPRDLSGIRISRKKGRIDWSSLDQYAITVKEQIPNVNTAMVLPKENSSYEEVIRVMDAFRAAEIRDIGISPL